MLLGSDETLCASALRLRLLMTQQSWKKFAPHHAAPEEIISLSLNNFEPKACVLGDVFFEKDAGKDARADQDFGSRIAVVCLGRTKLTSCSRTPDAYLGPLAIRTNL